jgi:hypothetical protein
MYLSSQLLPLLETTKILEPLIANRSVLFTLRPLPRLLFSNYNSMLNQLLLCVLIALAAKLNQNQKGNLTIWVYWLLKIFRTAQNELDNEYVLLTFGHVT